MLKTESPVVVEPSKDVAIGKEVRYWECAHGGDAGIPVSIFVLPATSFLYEMSSLLCSMLSLRHASTESKWQRQAAMDWNFPNHEPTPIFLPCELLRVFCHGDRKLLNA